MQLPTGNSNPECFEFFGVYGSQLIVSYNWLSCCYLIGINYILFF